MGRGQPPVPALSERGTQPWTGFQRRSVMLKTPLQGEGLSRAGGGRTETSKSRCVDPEERGALVGGRGCSDPVSCLSVLGKPRCSWLCPEASLLETRVLLFG